MVDEVSPWCEHAKSHERERAEQAELAIAHDTVVVRAEGDHAPGFPETSGASFGG